MKHIYLVRKFLNRFIRGYVSIITLYLLTILVVIVSQSCTQKDADLNTIYHDRSSLNYERIWSKEREKLRTFRMQHLQGLTLENLDSHEVSNSTLEEAEIAIQPLLKGSKELLFALGFDESDIEYLLDGNDESLLIPISFLLFEYQKQQRKNELIRTGGSVTYFSTSLYAQDVDWDKVKRCAATALGLDLIFAIGPEMGGKHDKWSRKALKKLIGKIAARMVGPVGVIIATASFTGCMYDIGFW